MISEQLDLLGPTLTQALTDRGFTHLTSVQAAVLDPALADCDLRITSQTGSGKTVATGLVLRNAVETYLATDAPKPGPCALVVVPTRELAKQVHEELGWLYAGYRIRTACVTGGSSYRDERRALGSHPAIVIGTPGRLVDHLQRGALEASAVSVVVLDEADRMLDLGFAEDLETIFNAAQQRKHTHMVSATLAPYVLRLADRYQSNPRHVQGTRLGEAHADIEHVVHLVPDNRRLDALVNLLIAEPEERTLVFVRTRADVTAIADELADAGFRVATLSGDMEQPARDRALAAFRHDRVRLLVATDVAARGIDIQGMTRVIHLEPPTDPDSYTHRSGRTGRAGKKGSSIVFVAPERQHRLRVLLNQARVSAKIAPLPDFESLQKLTDARTLQRLNDSMSQGTTDARPRRLAEELLRSHDAVDVVAMLIASTQKGVEPAPRMVPAIPVPNNDHVKSRRTQKRREDRDASILDERRRGARGQGGLESSSHERINGDHGRRLPGATWPRPERHGSKMFDAKAPGAKNFDAKAFGPKNLGSKAFMTKSLRLAPRETSSGGAFERESNAGWGMFQVTWGQLQGADPRRMLAVVCRRGNIRGADVGAIRIGPTSTIVEIRNDVVADFAAQARRPDPDEPRIVITQMRDGEPRRASRPRNGNRPRA